MTQVFHIATRKSMLALWQAQTIQKLLGSHGVDTALLPLTTTGDKMQKSQLADVHLSQNSISNDFHLNTGKGLFIKEIQEALLLGKAQIAVHSMKDLPIIQTKGLGIVSLLPRAGSRDVLVLSPKVLEETKLSLLADEEKVNLDFNKLKEILLTSNEFRKKEIGTSSLRRQMLLREFIDPHLNIQILRGNVDSRLKRVRNNEFSAIILAEAGLERLELLNNNDMFFLPINEFIPATAQGIIAVEIIEKNLELLNNIKKINCNKTCVAAGIERTVLVLLGGDCHSSIGVHYHYSNELFVICGRNGVYKKLQITVPANLILQINSLLAECNFIFSYFFDKLCSSSFAIFIKEQLLNHGFSEVSELN